MVTAVKGDVHVEISEDLIQFSSFPPNVMIIIIQSPLHNDIIFIKHYIRSQCEISHIINKKRVSENKAEDFTQHLYTLQ